MIDASKIMKDGCTFCRRPVPYEDEKPLQMTPVPAYSAFDLNRIYFCEYCDALKEEYIKQASNAEIEFHKDIPYQYEDKKSIHAICSEKKKVECFKCHADYGDITEEQLIELYMDLHLGMHKQSWSLICPNGISFSMLCPDCYKEYTEMLRKFNEKFIEEHAKLKE